MGVLLQVQDSVTTAINAVAPQTESAWTILQKGGFLMYPLYALFVATIFVFFERFFAINSGKKQTHHQVILEFDSERPENRIQPSIAKKGVHISEV